MGPAIDSLRPAVVATGRNRAFLVVALLTLVVSGTGSLVVRRIPVVGEAVDSLVVTPALVALLVGMAAAGLATDAASLGNGVESLRSSYRSLVGAYAVLVASVLAVVVAWAVEVVAVVHPRTKIGPRGALATSDPGVLLSNWPILAVSAQALALVLVLGLVVQFFDVAIVVGGESALSSFRASWVLFRDAPGSVLCYSVLRMLPVVVAGLVVACGYRLGASLAGEVGGVLFALPLLVAVGPLTFTFGTAYHVAYYSERVGSLPSGRRDGRE